MTSVMSCTLSTPSLCTPRYMYVYPYQVPVRSRVRMEAPVPWTTPVPAWRDTKDSSAKNVSKTPPPPNKHISGRVQPPIELKINKYEQNTHIF